MKFKRIKAFWVSLLVLFVLHSIISFVIYRHFTIRLPIPNGDEIPLDITTPAQRAAGVSIVQIHSRQTFTPKQVFIYICGGYMVFGGVLFFMFYRRSRASHFWGMIPMMPKIVLEATTAAPSVLDKQGNPKAGDSFASNSGGCGKVLVMMKLRRHFWTRVPQWLLFTIVPGISIFLRRTWSVSETFFLAGVIGFISPVLNALFFSWLPWQSVPFVFFPVLAVLVALLYWRVERGHFRTDWRAMLGTSGAGLLWAAGEIGSGWCFYHHVCMDGHMAHPPYPFWHYALDVGWALAVLVAAFWMRLVRSSLCILFATLAAYLVSYRFLFGSLGGRYEWLPL